MAENEYERESEELLDAISNGYELATEVYRQNASALMDELVPRMKVHKEELKNFNLINSCEFNVFNFLRKNENAVSDILADMLDPFGSHGQMNLFIAEFISYLQDKKGLFQNISDIEPKFVRREEPTENSRRIDIYIELDGYIIAIENKIGAGDQDLQVEHYIHEIVDKRLRKKGDFCFLYLTPTGDYPGENSITNKERENLENEKRFACISYYVDVKKWLELCKKKCKSDKYNHFISDFLSNLCEEG